MIDSDGYVVGYKKVDPEGWDYWTPRGVHYEVGKVSEIPRERCDEDSRNTCSSGLHMGSLEYAKNWQSGRGRVIIIRTNPKDVTAIPEEVGAPKLRCCRVEVLADYKGEEPVTLYGSDDEDKELCCNSCCDCGDDLQDYEFDDVEKLESIAEIRDLHGRVLAEVCDSPDIPKQNLIRDSKGRFTAPPKVKRDANGRFTK